MCDCVALILNHEVLYLYSLSCLDLFVKRLQLALHSLMLILLHT